MKTKQSINIMLQKWINPVKVPVSTFYIITFMNCSLRSRRSLIWVNTRTQTNKPWNWSTCWCAESLFSKTLQGHQLKPREQHWFQSGETPTCSSVTRALFGGFHWQHNKLPQLEAQGEVPCSRLLLKGSHGWSPMASHCNPHFYTHWHKSLLFMVLWTLFGISCLIGTAPVCVPDVSFS